MNSKEDIEALVNIMRHEAECREEQLKTKKRLFIFSVEIGRGKKLTPDERSLYEKTFLTAYILSGMAKRGNPSSNFDKLADGSLVNWLEFEPDVKAWLERALGHRLAEAEQPTEMPEEVRQMIAEGLSDLYDNKLSAVEIAEIIDRLEHPLDRA